MIFKHFYAKRKSYDRNSETNFVVDSAMSIGTCDLKGAGLTPPLSLG